MWTLSYESAAGRIESFAPTRFGAAEDDATDREAEPERPEGESAHGDHLAPSRQPLPVAERGLLLHRQRLAATLLADGAAGAQAKVEVVEKLGRLGRLVRHEASV